MERAFNSNFLDVEKWRKGNVKWYTLFSDIHQAQLRLNSFKFSVSISKREPTYGEIRFSLSDLQSFTCLKKFVGDYGFVVPVKGSLHTKILKGEKPLKYKHLSSACNQKSNS